MTHPTTDRVYEALGPGLTADDDGSLRLWLDGAGHQLGEVDDMVRDVAPANAGWSDDLDALFGETPEAAAPGWAREFDPETTSQPRWLAQFVGVRAPAALDDQQVRALIIDRPAFRRGTPAALKDAARVLLTGSQFVGLTERAGGSAYRLHVITYVPETPDPAAVEKALRVAKPAGLVLTYQAVPATSYAAREVQAAVTYSALEQRPALSYAQKEMG